MLRITARHADAWNTAWYGMPDERLRAQLDALDAAVIAEGRDPATIRRTVGVWIEDREMSVQQDPDAFHGSPTEVARLLAAYDQIGIDDLIVGLTPMTIEALERLAAARDAWTRAAVADAPSVLRGHC